MITIDGSAQTASGTVLQSCKAAGVDVPAFCCQDGAGGGHCRSCLVEVDGRLSAACTTQARDGQVVRTQTPELQAYRRDLGEMMAHEASPEGRVAQTLAEWGVDRTRYGAAPRESRPLDSSHPYLRFDMDRCILCRLCVHVCEEVQGQFVYTSAGRGAHSAISWGKTPFVDTACVSCGACAQACPTGAISDTHRVNTPAQAQVTRTTCSYCGVGCQLDVVHDGQQVLRIDGSQAEVNRGHLCVKGRYAHGFVRHPDRLTTPLIRENGQLRPASWEEALGLIAQKFGALWGKVGALSSSRCTNEENYLVQKWMRAGMFTNNVDCCARICHAPTAAGMRAVFGTGAATNSLADLERSDCLLVSGSNTTEAHPVTGARIKQAALRGAKLLVIDPRRTELAELADVHLMLRPGTNVPLLNSLAWVLVHEGLVNQEFVDQRCEGWAEYLHFLQPYSPEMMEATTGVPAAQVREAARLYGQAKRPMQVHGLGMTEMIQGTEGVMLLCNLALLVGGIGRPGVGVNPLRGQNNVQGAADMGCQPDSMTGYSPVTDPTARARFEQVWGRPLPSTPGMTIPQMLEAAHSGAIRGLYILGEDIVRTEPNTQAVIEAMDAMDFVVVQEIFLSDTAARAHVVLPGASFLEKDGTFTNGERRVQRVRKILEPPGQARADWQVLLSLMNATGFPQPFAHPSQILAEVAQVAPIFRGLEWERLEPEGLQWPVPEPGHPGTSILHKESFPTASGKATLRCVPYRPSPNQERGQLTLITGRALEHYNCGTMTRRTLNSALLPVDWLELSAEDAESRGLSEGQLARVRSDVGETTLPVRVSERVPAGVAFTTFHFPESGTNRLVGEVRDKITGCPEYKLVGIDVLAEEGQAQV